MRRTSGLVLLSLGTLGACGGSETPPERRATQPTVDVTPPKPGVTSLPTFDPTRGYHLDRDVGEPARAGVRPAIRGHRPIQLLLRSTPGEALAAVDGVGLGPTPVLWEGEADGTPRDFTFVLPGHALARYRFVPVTSGVVHGTLRRIIDGGPLTDMVPMAGQAASRVPAATSARAARPDAVPDTVPAQVPVPARVPDTIPAQAPDTIPAPAHP